MFTLIGIIFLSLISILIIVVLLTSVGEGGKRVAVRVPVRVRREDER